MSRVVGRTVLVEAVRYQLSVGRAVALHGPTGSGKSALLDELESRAEADRTRVLRAAGARTEQDMAFAGLQDLLDQFPLNLLDQLPAELRPAVRVGLVGSSPGDVPALGRGWLFLLERLAETGPVLVLVDDVHWMDPESVRVLQYAARRLAGRVGWVLTVGSAEAECLTDVPGLVSLEIPPLESGDLIELLGRPGLEPRVAQRVAAESGGLPGLALALGGAVGELPTVLGRPTGMPAAVRRMLRDRLAAQPKSVRATLLHAALMLRPTIRHLERAGRADAHSDLQLAAQAGLVRLRDDEVRFTPPGLVGVITGQVSAARRSELHRQLAQVATCQAHRVRHEALATGRPDADLALRLADAAGDAVRLGSRELAAELRILAAERAPVELADERVEWLATAIETAAPGNHADLVYRALDEFLGTDASPAQRVRVRLALVELTGTGLSLMEEVLATALADAAGDPSLVAGVLLQRARVHLMESRPAQAEQHAAEAVRLLEASGDQQAEALALPILAVSRRWIGAGDHDDVLRRARELPEPSAPGLQHTTPRYIAARFAFYDDRLEEAWSEQLSMLATLDRGAGIDLVHVLRCLVETGARMGRAREAMAYAARANGASADFDLDPHTGWYISAVAELVGGDLDRARTLAERGVAACVEQGDIRYLQRHLLAHGQAAVRLGDAKAAVRSLQRIRELERDHGISDPTVNRWQPELVSALVSLGDLDDATEVLAEARAALVDRRGTAGVSGQLDRAEAELLLACGELDGAHARLDRAGRSLARLGMQIELGRVRLTRAHVSRRRRRAAAARADLEAAYALFSAIHAHPWAQQVADELGAGAHAPAAAGDAAAGLTDSEVRLARLVCAGASNREIAERTFLSVKTVEATLTRIYRKLGVRSRTQLVTLLQAH